MVSHHAEQVELYFIQATALGQLIDKSVSVTIVLEDPRPIVPSYSHMMHCTLIRYPQWPCHVDNV